MDDASRPIRSKALRLSRRRGFGPSDRPDIEQELRLHLHLQAPKFDPGITSWEKFASYILDMRCISLVRLRRAKKRTPDREQCSLNEPVRDADGRPVDRHQVTPEAASTWQRLHDLERDVAEVRERLESETLRLIVDALGRGETVRAIARELNTSRSVVDRHIATIRAVFEDAGLREYL